MASLQVPLAPRGGGQTALVNGLRSGTALPAPPEGGETQVNAPLQAAHCGGGQGLSMQTLVPPIPNAGVMQRASPSRSCSV